jgi:hypothetical protein
MLPQMHLDVQTLPDIHDLCQALFQLPSPELVGSS